MNETTALKPSNIYVAAFRVESRRLFVSVFHALYTFPRVLKFFLKWPLSSIIYIFFSLHYFFPVSPVGFCIHFSQCNISSIMKVQLIT